MKTAAIDNEAFLAHLCAAAEALDSGAKMAEVLEATGLNYSQAWYFWMRLRVERGDFGKGSDLKGLTGDKAKRAIELARTVDPNPETEKPGQSWGFIAVRFALPEARVRRMFTDQTELKSQGLRIGRGGRFYRRDEVLYEDVLKPTGTAIPNEAKGEQIRQAAKVERAQVAEGQVNELWTKAHKELVALAKKLGIATQNVTKVQLITRIRREQVRLELNGQ